MTVAPHNCTYVKNLPGERSAPSHSELYVWHAVLIKFIKPLLNHLPDICTDVVSVVAQDNFTRNCGFTEIQQNPSLFIL